MKKLCMILPLALILCLMVGCQDKEAMAELEEFKAQAEVEEQNKELIRNFFEQLDKGNVGIVKELFAPNVAYYSPSGSSTPMSQEDAIESTKMFFSAFPDLEHSIGGLIASGDMVVVRATVQGTHKGEFAGIPATGNEIEFSFIAIVRIENGKIVEEWQDMDTLGFMQQLGMELNPKEEK